MKKLRLLDLFSGIGGFSLGLERSGAFETVAFCEIEPFPRRVLAKHWPKVPCYDDVRTLTAQRLAADGITVDAICGGFPCQDLSLAGKRRGLTGQRSGLWSEIIRLSSEIRPRYIIVENVANLFAGPSQQPGGWFGRVLGDLAECGYDAEWENIPAAAVGAPHRRERAWLVAYNQKNGSAEFERSYFGENTSWSEGAIIFDKFPCVLGRARSFLKPFPSKPAICRMVDGVPSQLDRLGALGNAVVPQIPELIGRAILRAEQELLEAT